MVSSLDIVLGLTPGPGVRSLRTERLAGVPVSIPQPLDITTNRPPHAYPWLRHVYPARRSSTSWSEPWFAVDHADVSRGRERVVGIAAVDEWPLVGRVGSVPC